MAHRIDPAVLARAIGRYRVLILKQYTNILLPYGPIGDALFHEIVVGIVNELRRIATAAADGTLTRMIGAKRLDVPIVVTLQQYDDGVFFNLTEAEGSCVHERWENATNRCHHAAWKQWQQSYDSTEFYHQLNWCYHQFATPIIKAVVGEIANDKHPNRPLARVLKLCGVALLQNGIGWRVELLPPTKAPSSESLLRTT